MLDAESLAYYLQAGDVESATANPDGTITLTLKNAIVTVEAKTVEDR